MSFMVIRNATREELGERDHFDDALRFAQEEARPVDGDIVIRDSDDTIVAHVWHDGDVEIYDDVDLETPDDGS